MTVSLFRNVRLLDLEHQEGAASACDVLVENGLTAIKGENLAAPQDAQVIDGKSNLLKPRLVNAHFHSTVNHMKGAADLPATRAFHAS